MAGIRTDEAGPLTPTPDVTVVIATRDRWPLLSTHGLPSALGQEGVAFEVVVVDDGSSDGTGDRVEALADPRVRLVRLPRSVGPAAARNRGIEAARAAWTAFLDDDDLWSPRKLRTQLDAAAAADVDWVYAATAIVDERGLVLRTPTSPAPAELELSLLEGNRLWGGPSAVLARTERLRALGGFDESLRCFEDWDLWLRLAAAARAAACDDVLVAHVEHAASTLFREDVDVLAQHERMLGKHRRVTPDDRRVVLEWLAGEQAQAGHRVAASRLYLAAALRHRSAGNLVAAVGALLGRSGLRAAAALHLAVRGRTHLDAGTSPQSGVELPWLAARRAGGT